MKVVPYYPGANSFAFSQEKHYSKGQGLGGLAG
jgi:hypothetical protein